MTIRLRPVASVVATATGVLASTLVPLPVAAAHHGTGCYDPARPITVEEQRLPRTTAAGGDPVSAQILRGTGLDRNVDVFTRLLCRLPNRWVADVAIRRQGKALWSAAVARTKRTPRPGELPATDDRGLYWARISMAKALRQWTPRFGLSDTSRAALIESLEYTSRGITSSRFSPGVRKVLVTGFDPFTLDADIRIGNPSGANALSLDGRRWRIGGRTVEIQTVMFPVRYADFDQGMVEDALRPHYRAGRQRADFAMTASQGRIGIFDLEVFNGRRRSVSSIGDNNNIWGGGTITAPVVSPGMPPGPEWLTSSLPMTAMAATPVAPFTTRINTSVLEIPAGQTTPVRRPDGPTPGSIASQGAPGGYLSNEVAYRNTLQRDLLYPSMPAGHLHVPVLQFDPANTTAITDPAYERNRDTIVTGAHAILRNGLTG